MLLTLVVYICLSPLEFIIMIEHCLRNRVFPLKQSKLVSWESRRGLLIAAHGGGWVTVIEFKENWLFLSLKILWLMENIIFPRTILDWRSSLFVNPLTLRFWPWIWKVWILQACDWPSAEWAPLGLCPTCATHARSNWPEIDPSPERSGPKSTIYVATRNPH